MALSPAARVQSKKCLECGEPAVITMRSVPCSNRYFRRHPGRFMKFTCLVVRAWTCRLGHAEDAGTWFPPPADPVRPEIVNAIRRLKAAGNRFFEWEKTA